MTKQMPSSTNGTRFTEKQYQDMLPMFERLRNRALMKKWDWRTVVRIGIRCFKPMRQAQISMFRRFVLEWNERLCARNETNQATKQKPDDLPPRPTSGPVDPIPILQRVTMDHPRLLRSLPFSNDRARQLREVIRPVLGHVIGEANQAVRMGVPQDLAEYEARMYLTNELLSIVEDMEDRFTALHLAARQGRLEMVTALLGQGDGAEVNATTKWGETPLILAACTGRVEVVRYLLEFNEIDCGWKCADGCTALHYAAHRGHQAVVAMLLVFSDEAELNAVNDRGQTPLYLAAERGHVGVVRQLLEQVGIDRGRVTQDGITAFHVAVLEGRSEVISELLRNGSDAEVSTTTKQGATSLHLAAEKGYSDVVQQLLAQDVIDCGQQSETGVSALHVAAQEGHHEVVALLLAHSGGAEINVMDDRGQTPLHLAAGNGRVEVVQQLLGQDEIDCRLQSQGGFNALHWAAQGGHGEVVAALLAHKEGVDVNAVTDLGATPLVLAAGAGHVQVVRQLLELDEVDCGWKLAGGLSALHYAAHAGYEEVVVELLRYGKGVDVNEVTEIGSTPLHLAATFGQPEVVRVLLDQDGIEYDLKDVNGATPLDVAMQNGHQRVVEVLQSWKAGSSNLGG